MATRKEARKKSLLSMLALLIVAAVVVAAVVVGRSWLNSRPGPEPHEVSVTASVGERSQEIFPYLIAEPGVESEEGTVPTFEVGEDETLRIDVPESIYDHDWQAVLIYDDPAANDQRLYGPRDADFVDVAGSAAPTTEGGDRPKLMVVEIQSVMIGTDDSGEPTPYTTVWSVATQNA